MIKLAFYFGVLCKSTGVRLRKITNQYIGAWHAGYNARAMFFKTSSPSLLYAIYSDDYEQYRELANRADIKKLKERKERGVIPIDWESVHARAGRIIDYKKFDAVKAS